MTQFCIEDAVLLRLDLAERHAETSIVNDYDEPAAADDVAALAAEARQLARGRR